MTDDLFATEKVMTLVKQGIPFREAYAKVKDAIDNKGGLPLRSYKAKGGEKK